MNVKRLMAFLKPHKAEIKMASLTLIVLVFVMLVLSYTVHLYRNPLSKGENVVRPGGQGAVSGNQSGSLNYKELSEAYASLEGWHFFLHASSFSLFFFR